AGGSSSSSTELWGAGDGSKGQLGPLYRTAGITTTFQPLDLRLEEYGLDGYATKRVAACWETSYVVMSKGGHRDVVLSMGGNDYGDLGVGDKVTKNTGALHLVDFTPIIGSCQNMEIVDICAGPHHVAVLLTAIGDDGARCQHLAGWGASRHGQLGLLPSSSGRPVAFAPTPREIQLDDMVHDPAILVALGNQHSLFLHASGRLSALGSDKKGQTRGLTSVTDIQQVGCTWNGSYILSNSPEAPLMSVGSHTKGQLGRRIDDAPNSLAGPRPVEFPPPFHGRSLIRFACGSEHVLALTSSGPSNEVWGWGWNEHGNLGIGSLEDVHIPVKVWPPSSWDVIDTFAVGVWSGCGTSFIAVSEKVGSGDDP
ncbi:regulator of chromosome condensation 1/beta-lactamase-inhibitor protein II, partial [Amylostereum chailletii]